MNTNIRSIASVVIMALFLGGCAQTGSSQNSTATQEPAMTTEQEVVESTPVSPVQAAQIDSRIKATAPEQYTVKKGDTLWDISNKFLNQPWYWPEIWHVNQQVKNPHLIYPGDVLSIYYVNGQPRVGLNSLSPRIRTSGLNQALDAPISAVRPFLTRPTVVSEEEMLAAPHIVDSQEKHLVYGLDDIVYVRGIGSEGINQRYNVYRPGKKLYDPETEELLGYYARYASEANVFREDEETSTAQLVNTVREVLRGDRLLPIGEDPATFSFIPSPPPDGTNGQIVELFDSISGIASLQIAIMNVGDRDGVRPGNVFSAQQTGRVVKDKFHKGDEDLRVRLPDEESGLIMIFSTSEKLSYGLVMESVRKISIGDKVIKP